MDGFKLLEAIGLELDLPVISKQCAIKAVLGTWLQDLANNVLLEEL